jgi:hypothetical protein
VRSVIRLEVKAASNATARVQVIDNLGRNVMTQASAIMAGTTPVSLNLPSAVTAGVYTVITELNGQLTSFKVVVQ